MRAIPPPLALPLSLSLPTYQATVGPSPASYENLVVGNLSLSGHCLHFPQYVYLSLSLLITSPFVFTSLISLIYHSPSPSLSRSYRQLPKCLSIHHPVPIYTSLISPSFSASISKYLLFPALLHPPPPNTQPGRRELTQKATEKTWLKLSLISKALCCGFMLYQCLYRWNQYVYFWLSASL